jgi:hypothetical protein
MRRSFPAFLLVLALCPAFAQAQAPEPPMADRRSGLALGASGWRSNDGTTVNVEVVWVGADMNDGIGVRFIREGLAPKAHGYAAMIVIGGPPHLDKVQWMRLDFGLGYAGQQSASRLAWYKRHGVGAQLGMTLSPRRIGSVRPELNGWAIVGTSAQFLGVSAGLRILSPLRI